MGIDPSTKTGCVLCTKKPTGLHVEDHGEIEYKGQKGMQRVQSIGQRMAKFLDVWEPQVVVMEGYGYANMHSLVTLVEIGTMIRLCIVERRIPLCVVAPNTLKKWVTGKGNAKKDVMMLETYKRWNFEGTDNEVDAFGLAALGLYAGNPDLEPELSAGQKKVMQAFRAEHLDVFS